MTQVIPLQIVGGSNFGQYPKISNEKTYNMYISDGALVPFAGHKKITNLLTNGVGRALYSSSRFNHLISVVGNRISAIDKSGAIANIGRLDTENGNVFIAENNGTQIAITDSSGYYVYDWNTSVFQKVTLPFSLEYITFMDTYIIGAVRGTNSFQLSNNNNAINWPNNENTQGFLQTKGDVVRAVIQLGRQLIVMGNIVTDIFYDSPNSVDPFPFHRNNTYSIEYGVVNPATIAISDNMVIWLGANDKQGIAILVSSGQEAQQISTDGVNYQLSQLSQPSNAFGMLFKQAGHLFYQITWPADNLTLIYDFNNKQFFNLTDENGNYHIARSVAFFNNDYYFVSAKDDGLYRMDSSYYTYDGKEIPRVRQLPNFSKPDSSPFSIKEMSIYLEQGNSSEDERIEVSISKDGSQNYRNIKDTLMNREGMRVNRYRLLNLGRANEFSVRYSFWGKDRFVIKGGSLTIQ